MVFISGGLADYDANVSLSVSTGTNGGISVFCSHFRLCHSVLPGFVRLSVGCL